MQVRLLCALVVAAAALSADAAPAGDLDFVNHGRPILDAHNCYPYDGKWSDRVQRALRSGFPVSIEQDLAWYVDPATGQGRVVVSHTPRTTGREPTLRDYFFEQVRPVVEKALAQNNRAQWPVIVLHFDFKDTRPELLQAVWKLLGEYEPWLSTAVKTDDPNRLSPIERRPILVVTEESDAQAKVFFDDVPVGAKLRLFGSAHTHEAPAGSSREEQARWDFATPPEQLLTEKATNYRRWWNNAWSEVEEGGQTRSGDWTAASDARLRALVDHAHRQGLWIRFYTLDGVDDPAKNLGWGNGYNFGSPQKAQARWKAAIADGVNFIATDQYEDLAPYLDQTGKSLRPAG